MNAVDILKSVNEPLLQAIRRVPRDIRGRNGGMWCLVGEGHYCSPGFL